jgi:hypothetical protein
MRNLTSALIVSALVLGGCGAISESRFNPLNWFGRAQVDPVSTAAVNPLIPTGRGGISLLGSDDTAIPAGPLVDQVTDLTVEPIPGGALIRATALSDRVGAFNVTLEPVNDGLPVDGVLSLEMRAYTAPAGNVPTTERARSYVAALRLSDSDLEAVRTIRVTAARNAATVARR